MKRYESLEAFFKKELVTGKMFLYVWIDTIDDKSVTSGFSIEFPSTMDREVCREILRRVNQYLPIFIISANDIEYHLADTEKFMNKPCEGC